MNISLFGLGRVGLPLAIYIASKKQTVWGYDIDPERITQLKSLKFPFKEKGAQALLAKTFNKSFKLAQSPKQAIQNSQVTIITVGTPVNAYMNPSFKQVEAVISSILPHLSPNQLIIFRSTLAPGTTQRLSRYIEKNSNFKVGKSIFIAYCPERTAEGNTIEEMPQIPQLIGADDPKSISLAKDFFSTLSPSSLTSDSKSVEIAKLTCNMYRYVNFALANELMMISQAHGRDIYEINHLANHNYKRGGLSKPGFSAGPCLFKDGFFLINDIPYTELISTAWTVNERIPNYIVSQLGQKLNLEKRKIAVLGLAFKKNSDDPRDSLAYKIIKLLENKGATVLAHDPYISSEELDVVLQDATVIIMATNHDFYQKIGLDNLKSKTGKKQVTVVDIWNMFDTNKLFN